MRVYSEAELREMVEPLSKNIAFEYGLYPIGRYGHGYYFTGSRLDGAVLSRDSERIQTTLKCG